MTAKEFIESGLLELYALGQLSAQETAEVERMCRHFPEVAAELQAIEESMEALDRSTSIQPPAAAKERLFRLIGAEDENPSAAGSAAAVEHRRSWLVAASISVAVLSLASAVFFYGKWAASSRQYEALAAQNTLIATKLNQVKASVQEKEHLLAVATDESTRRIELSATREGTPVQVFVYWNSKTSEVYLDPGNLSLPGSDQDYQLWAIVGGKPMDMGVVDMNDPQSLQKMKPVEGAVAFAITLEPKGGKPEPTLENMVAMGKVST